MRSAYFRRLLQVLSQRRTLKDLHDSGRLQDRLGIPRDAPPPDLPSFAQSSASASATGGRGRSPPRLARLKTKVSAIHVELSPERPSARSDESTSASEDERDFRNRDRRRRGSYGSTDRSRSPDEFAFVDRPFKPSARAGKASAPLPPPTKATSKAAPPARNGARPAPSDDEDESRYSVGKPPAGKKRKANADAFAAPTEGAGAKGKGRAKPAAAARDSSPEEGEISASSSSASASSDLYIEGQEELIPTSDESDFEDRERKFRQAKKTERRKTRQAKRDYWSAKGGDATMDAGLRYGGLLSD